jgi:multicomponent K+:H+ antiporter subunit E
MRLLPYPLLGLGLMLMWLLLAGFTLGQFVLAVAVAVLACQALKALGEKSPHIRRWLAIPELTGIVLYDIIRSNMAVSSLLLSIHERPRHSGFITVPIRLRHPSGLAILSIIITSTPGTAWLDYNSARSEVLIHVFDLVDREEWVDLIANRYERLLAEIFE